MNPKYLFVISLFIVILMVFLFPEIVSSQPSFPDDPDQIPVDGGLAILFVTGSGYAIKKYRQKRNFRGH